MIVAAAGNAGPSPGSITLPACDANVAAVGALTFIPLDIYIASSRGPTKEGLIKPDMVWFGINLNTASAKSDDDFVVKSGTSFAAPFLIGGGFNGWELIRRIYGEEATVTAMEWAKLVETASVKPEGAPPGKDNTYGYGIPWGSLIAKQMMPAAAGVSETIETVTPLIGLGMVGMMMAGMMRGMKV